MAGLSAHFVYHIHLRIPGLCLIVVMSTNSTSPLKPGNLLWGIYHTDREYARVIGDPLRTTVEAPTKAAAEETARRLGFSDPWAHPVKSEEETQAQWISTRRPGHRQELARKPTRGIRV